MSSKTILAKVRGFTPLIDSIVAELGLPCAAVFGVAYRYCQMPEGVCRASQFKIAKRSGVSRKTVNLCLAALVGSGYLEDLTPELRNHPHVYRDTGKASIGLDLYATIADDD